MTTSTKTTIPVFFKSPEDFRQWLDKHHQTEKEVVVGFYKMQSGKSVMTWSESVDQALCYGWIDGVRRSIDDKSYCIRFTQRKPSSTWSAVNIAKVHKLTDKGLMQPAGLAAFGARREQKSKIYSYEQEKVSHLDTDLQKRFKADVQAWKFFSVQAPSYQKTIVHWIMSGKQTETRLKRLQQAIDASHDSKRL